MPFSTSSRYHDQRKLRNNSPKKTGNHRDSFILSHSTISQAYKPQSPHNFLLIKNPNPNFNITALIAVIEKCYGFQEIIPVPNSSNIYAKFLNDIDLQITIERNADLFSSFGVEANIVNKLPLDLNESSKVVLITFYNLKINIDVFVLKELFCEFEDINKISIFKKKSHQALLEFSLIDEAIKFKEIMHNANFKELFCSKVQYTKKDNIKIINSSRLEFDFTKELKNAQLKSSIDLGAHIKGTSGGKEFDNNENLCNVSYDPTKLDNGLNVKNERWSGLIVRNLAEGVTHKYLFNLFSLYGELQKIDINKDDRSAYIMYRDSNSYKICTDLLNGICLFNNRLDFALITNNGTTSVELSNEDLNQVDNCTNHTIHSLDNYPSNIIKISNKSRSISHSTLKSMIENFETVQSVHKTNENSIIVFFDTKDAAVNILSRFHNKKLGGKSLKVNFVHESHTAAIEPKNATPKTYSMQNLYGSNYHSFRIPLKEKREWEENCNSSKFSAL